MKHIATVTRPLLEILEEFSPDSSKSTLRSWVKEGRVTLDGRVPKSATVLVTPGQHVVVSPKKKFGPGGIEILYDDAYLTVIDKPEGLLSVATDLEKEKTAYALLRKYYYPKNIYVVHRLDQATSGVMLFALDEKICEELKKTFENHDIERCYYGIAEGRLQNKKGVWESYLYEDRNYVVHSTPDSRKGTLSITHYEVEAQSKNHSFVKFTLHTGKKNQIRVHSSDAGHPLTGDKKYGAQGNILRRLGLHAYSLAFEHPVTKKKMRFISPIPEAFYKVVKPVQREADA